ncbi:hypothetical protein [Nocardia suismassiliense]|uniref:hypothetical protein n=1 Tax=Nocardia suismassiliense TaxID=2077092 RepID=UPI00131F04E2|nr:hypothetical protein [Nocardia suismassiliense]
MPPSSRPRPPDITTPPTTPPEVTTPPITPPEVVIPPLPEVLLPPPPPPPPPPPEVVEPPPTPNVVAPPRNPVRTPAVVPPAPEPLPLPPPQLPPAAMGLTPSSVGPGVGVTASGHGCQPGVPVDVAIGDVAVGKTVAGVDGAFEVPLATGAMDVGRHQVTAKCGRTLAAPLDVVLVGSVGSGTSTLTVILFFLVLGGWYYGHRLVSHLPARRGE